MANKPKQTIAHASEQQLLKQLKAAPLVDVLGVLSDGGVFGVRSQGDTQWTLLFCFASWRIAGGPLMNQELIVRRKVRKEQIDEYREIILAPRNWTTPLG
jgi:hypothetical protein